MKKVAPYIETNCSEIYKLFILEPFNINMLFNVDKNVQTSVIFNGWRGKNMGSFYKFTNEENIILEFYSNIYIAIFPNKTVQQTMLSPVTLNDFINDMSRINVPLYWDDWIDDHFEPCEYLNKNEIKEYFAKLLNQLDKAIELQ